MIGVVCQSNSCNILRLRIREYPVILYSDYWR